MRSFGVDADAAHRVDPGGPELVSVRCPETSIERRLLDRLGLPGPGARMVRTAGRTGPHRTSCQRPGGRDLVGTWRAGRVIPPTGRRPRSATGPSRLRGVARRNAADDRRVHDPCAAGALRRRRDDDRGDARARVKESDRIGATVVETARLGSASMRRRATTSLRIHPRPPAQCRHPDIRRPPDRNGVLADRHPVPDHARAMARGGGEEAAAVLPDFGATPAR